MKHIIMKNIMYVGAILLIASCNPNKKKADAYGNFEATPVTISAEATGKIKALDLTEGMKVKKGQVVGWIDTTQLHLQKLQMKASIQAIEARRPGIASRMAILNEQLQNAQREKQRFENLAKEGAATQKKLDDINNQVEVFNKKIASAQTEYGPLSAELKGLQAKLSQIEEQIKDAVLTVPMDGTVLVKTVEAHEMVKTGMPIYRMANLRSLILRVYVSGSQLSNIQLGQQVTVRIDKNKKDYETLSGTVTWISDESEFTPKIIQTKEDRVDMVYAVKVKVANNGQLKIGMPGEVIFNQPKS